jgi:MFS family permease
MVRRPAVILALLTGLNLLNYLDRFVLSAVLPRIETEFNLSHGAAGFLGTLFLLGYFLTSPIFGALADRGKRTGLIALGVVIWSLATLASGLATGMLSLAIARAAVGVGEASYATIAPTLIDDLAPEGKKGTWLAIFYAASPIGAALGYVTGGLVEKTFGWRAAFYFAGGPGLILAIACLFLTDPTRKEIAKPGPLLATLRPLLKVPLYLKAVFGYAAYTFAIGGFAYWGPTFLFQQFEKAGLTLAKANIGMGAVTVMGGAVGTALGGVWADRRTRDCPGSDPASVRARVTHLLGVCAVGSAVGAPLAALAILSPSANLFFAAFFVAEVFLFLSTSPINAAILDAVPPAIRASAMAASIFTIHMLGDLWSPPGVGKLADLVTMRVAMLSLPVAIAGSAILWWPREPGPRPRERGAPGGKAELPR